MVPLKVEVFELSANVAETDSTWGISPANMTSRTFLKFCDLSWPPSRAPVPQGYKQINHINIILVLSANTGKNMYTRTCLQR